MRNDNMVTLELAGIQVTAAIEEAESFPSPHTGRELRRLQVSFVIDDEATNARIVETLQAHQEVVLLAGPGSVPPSRRARTPGPSPTASTATTTRSSWSSRSTCRRPRS
jgi:hypothetical protein